MKSSNLFLSFLLIAALALSFGFCLKVQDDATLHMFIIADTEDTSIGAIADYPKMQKEARMIADMSKLKLSKHYYEKKDISPSFLADKIKQLKCGDNDVIWFYYTGHGFNSQTGLGNFPGFKLGDTQFSLEWIHQSFLKKKARLVISMFDCCNWTAEKKAGIGQAILLSPPKQKNYFALFRETQGSIKIASNTSGYRKYSYGSADYGGFFSIAFRQILDKTLKGSYENCNWDNLLEDTKELTKKRVSQLEGNKEQIPFYETNVFRYH